MSSPVLRISAAEMRRPDRAGGGAAADLQGQERFHIFAFLGEHKRPVLSMDRKILYNKAIVEINFIF